MFQTKRNLAPLKYSLCRFHNAYISININAWWPALFQKTPFHCFIFILDKTSVQNNIFKQCDWKNNKEIYFPQ